MPVDQQWGVSSGRVNSFQISCSFYWCYAMSAAGSHYHHISEISFLSGSGGNHHYLVLI